MEAGIADHVWGFGELLSTLRLHYPAFAMFLLCLLYRAACVALLALLTRIGPSIAG
jgi:hypothetical protein